MKYLTPTILTALITVSVALSPATLSANEAHKKAAIEAAQKWLALVDKGDYARSWDDAASLLKSQITRGEWAKKLAAVLPPFGKAKERKVSNAIYATTLPGAPDGHYVTILFDTSFSEKASAVETITPMLENGTWRVAGYFIR